MYSIASFYRSDLGRQRENNEDAIGARAPQNAQQLRHSGWIYVVADGLGGHSFGERASQHVVQTLLNGYYSLPQYPPNQRLRLLIQQANAEIYQEAKLNLAEGERMATTVVAAAIHKGKLYLAHIGDSRAYLIRKERVYRLTQDHSVVGEMVRSGVLTEDEARTSKLRNRLTRSVGSRPEVEIEVSQPIPLQPDDLILLCTDGLSQYATNIDLLKAAHGKPREIVERLIQLANARGGADNITVAAIRYGKPILFTFQWSPALAIVLATIFLLIGLVLGAALGGGNRILSVFLPATFTPTPTATATAPATIAPTFTLTPSPTFTETPTPNLALTPTLIPLPSVTFTPPLTVTTTP